MLTCEVKRQSPWIVKDWLPHPPIGSRPNPEVADEVAVGVEELDAVVPSVSHGNEGAIRGDCDAPRVGEVPRGGARRPHLLQEAPVGVKGHDPVVVFVRDQHPVLGCVVGNASGTEELARSSALTSKTEGFSPVRVENEDLVVLSIGNPDLQFTKKRHKKMSLEQSTQPTQKTEINSYLFISGVAGDAPRFASQGRKWPL